MTTYVIGDVQGCFNELVNLLDLIKYDPSKDSLWFTGDLVNRGPDSFKVLSLVASLPNIITVLGNHDLHLLATVFAKQPLNSKDTFQDVLKYDQDFKLCHWLRTQPLIYYDEKHKCTLVHAGIPPQWSIKDAITKAQEVEKILSGDDFVSLLKNIYGNTPKVWDDNLIGWDRFRIIINYFVRMRFCTANGKIDLETKNKSIHDDQSYQPWYEIKNRKTKKDLITFGHWAALNGKTNCANAIALDTGCVWGFKLTAYALETKSYYHVQSDYHFDE